MIRLEHNKLKTIEEDITHPKIKQALFERYVVKGNTSIPKYVERAKFTQYEDFYLDAIVVSCEVALSSVKDSTTTQTDFKTNRKTLKRYPETLWDYVKEKYAPEWFKERYPVSYVEYYQDINMVTENTTTTIKVFPDIQISDS